jgi:tetratricopeptide (TPR) repeat protein
MSLWNELINHALDHETLQHEQEQLAWIAREPANPRPYYNLALLRRMQWKEDEGLALLLEAIRLSPEFSDAHVALTEVYAVRGDYAAARRHAQAAEQHGRPEGTELLRRHGIAE